MKKLLLIITIMMLVPTLATASQQKQISITPLKYEPLPAEPGNVVDVWLSIANQRETIQEFEIEFHPEYPFTLASGHSKKIEVGTIPALETAVVKFRLFVDLNARNEEYNVTWFYNFKNQGGIIEYEAPISVKASDASVTVTDYKINPYPVRPGGEANLSLSLTNNGNIRVKNVDVQLDLPEDMSTMDSGTVKRINEIPPGATKTVTYRVVTSSEIETLLYTIPIEVTFKDERNNNYNTESEVAALVNAPPSVMVLIDNSEIETPNSTGLVSFKVVNSGAIDMKFLTFNLIPSNNYKILSVSKKDYLGNLDADDFEITEFLVKPQKEEFTFDVKLEYADPYNKKFEENFDVPFRIITQKDRGQQETNYMMIIIAGLIIVGLLYWGYKKARKKKK